MKNMGDGRRVARVEKEVQAVIAQYLIAGFRQRLPGLVTVAAVRMPGDLRSARVYVSVLGEENLKDQVVEILQNSAGEIQRYIGDQLKMRYCPKLTFYPDHTTEQVLKIEKIIHEIETERTVHSATSSENKEVDET